MKNFTEKFQLKNFARSYPRGRARAPARAPGARSAPAANWARAACCAARRSPPPGSLRAVAPHGSPPADRPFRSLAAQFVPIGAICGPWLLSVSYTYVYVIYDGFILFDLYLHFFFRGPWGCIRPNFRKCVNQIETIQNPA